MAAFLSCRTLLSLRSDAATSLRRLLSQPGRVVGLSSLLWTPMLFTRAYAGARKDDEKDAERKAAMRAGLRKNMVARFGPRYEERPNVPLLLYEEAVRNGYPASYKQFSVERRSKMRKGQSCLFVTTLNLENGLAQGQFIHFIPRILQPWEVFWQGHLLDGHQYLGYSKLARNTVAEEEFLCPYFDRQAGLMRFRRKDGKDSKWSVDLIHEAKKERSWRPFLLLAIAEGYLEHCPDGYLRSLDREKLLNEGYYTRSPIEKHGRIQQHLKWARSESALRWICHPDPSQLQPGQTHFRGFPYIDNDVQLRFWNVDSKSDIRFRPQPSDGTGYREGFSGATIKKLNPRFFELAQHLGYWKTI